MTLRERLTMAAATVVAVAIVVAAVVVYTVVRHQLYGQVDGALRARVAAIQQAPPDRKGSLLELPPAVLGQPAVFVQLIGQGGKVWLPADEQGELPHDNEAGEVASGRRQGYFRDVSINGQPYRVLTAPLGQGIAVQAARPLDETNRTLHRLFLLLLAIACAGVAVAAVAGAGVARLALRPIRALSETTRHVRETGDLQRRVEVSSSDELGALAADFNAMLEALERSLGTQRQLVADASHELRTPLTSLRTNIEVLAAGTALAEADRRQLLADVLGQIEEMSALVADVVELAREGGQEREREEIRLDLLAEQSAKRFMRREPRAQIETKLAPVLVAGQADELERAISNLLSNAVKWGPGQVIELTVARRDQLAELRVRDHGPGISADDLPHVFERFYRSIHARGKPGSGLGLAIVSKVAEEHGGEAIAENASDGGAVLTVRLPALDEPAAG